VVLGYGCGFLFLKSKVCLALIVLVQSACRKKRTTQLNIV
jgi:hypothetical protein